MRRFGPGSRARPASAAWPRGSRGSGSQSGSWSARSPGPTSWSFSPLDSWATWGRGLGQARGWLEAEGPQSSCRSGSGPALLPHTPARRRPRWARGCGPLEDACAGCWSAVLPRGGGDRGRRGPPAEGPDVLSGICRSNPGAEHVSGAASGAGGRGVGAESRAEQHAGERRPGARRSDRPTLVARLGLEPGPSRGLGSWLRTPLGQHRPADGEAFQPLAGAQPAALASARDPQGPPSSLCSQPPPPPPASCSWSTWSAWCPATSGRCG